MKNAFLLFSILSFQAIAQTITFEENFNNGVPASWSLVNQDNLIPVIDSFDNAWIKFNTSTDTCVASTSYYNPEGASADYLISPKITLSTFSKLVWSAQSLDPSYPDSYVVLISTTDSLPASFTDTLMYVGNEFYYWHKRSVQLDVEGYANQDVYIAIKNITTDGYVLLIDDFKILGSDFASTPSHENLVSVYPNPAQQVVFFEGLEENSIIQIFDVNGSIVLSTTDKNISIAHLPNGMYFYTVSSDKTINQGKFIKN